MRFAKGLPLFVQKAALAGDFGELQQHVTYCSMTRWEFQVPLIAALFSANGHITLNAPVLVRSLKLSNVEPC